MPVIKEKPKITKIVKKRTVIIECKVQSSFTPQCTWFKETKAVKEDSTHAVHIEQIRDVSYWADSHIFAHREVNCDL